MRRFLLLILSIFLVSVSCVSKATPVAKSIISPEVQPQKPLKAAWEEDWENTIKAAQSEGKVVIYSPSNPKIREAQSKAFKERFRITVEQIPGTAGQLAAKIIAEYKANIYYVDIHAGGASTVLTILKPAGVVTSLYPSLVLPEVLDPKVWYGGELPFVDKDQTTAIIALAPSTTFIINTSLVQPGEVNSYQDLLDPKWKRKIILADPTMPPGGDIWFTAYVLSGALSLDYMRSLAKQEPFISRDRRMAGEWLSRGKYAISIGTPWTYFEEFHKFGLTVKHIDPLEGEYLSSASGSIALMKKAPHPNAAKVFINWFLSKEGATITAIAHDKDSTRLDVPTEDLTQFRLRQPGVKYILGDTEEITLKRPEYQNMAREIFGHLLPR